MSRARRLTAGVFLFTVVSPPAHGHQAWVLPEFFDAARAPIWLNVEATWGDQLFVAGQAGSGLGELRVIGHDGRNIALASTSVDKTKTVGKAQLTHQGTYRVEASAPATYWTRIVTNDGEKWLRKSKDQVESTKISRADLYWSKAVVFVTVGGRTDASLRPSKDPLELELLDHPSQLISGESMKLRVLSHGKVVPSQTVNVFAEGTNSHKPTLAGRSDENGICELTFKKPGKYLLVAQQETAAKDDPKTDIYSYNFYLLINVQPAD